ncbi:MAG: 2-amino-4-hydroxy-6-hydroxymethyldihydropteridine diphosphokinase [Candidatus Cloacimonetes bacterium HGW-Cloacimonetes-3]|jgi:2-amino-4-hydroxy-6-hydroxymethyldihydropteridine diphosphokinase|nr:MAG: 2-amino-4-hydroxy-6-hydroxymethyldihydropteridine diphosphokinase [Candidatus Cloacimonetes bacterium HGW-Cloacimonetes-3]
MIYHLCLGANMNEPEKQIETATKAILSVPEVTLLRQSSLIRSIPYGKTDQADFYNQVLEIKSTLSPQDLLAKLLEIESRMGRIRIEKWGERLIDIDILLAENLTLDTRMAGNPKELPELVIPHPDFHNRLFALQLLNELIPETIHPIMHKSITELYYLLRKSGGRP